VLHVDVAFIHFDEAPAGRLSKAAEALLAGMREGEGAFVEEQE
jgi:hypothetical protein